MWGGTHNIYFVDSENNIALGYRSLYNDELETLEGLNLKTGKVVWKRQISRKMGWDNIYYLNDSTVLVVASGLHTINLRTGKGWDYNSVTYEINNTRPTFWSSGSFFFGNYASNKLVDSVSIYHASKNEIAKLDLETGTVLWKTEILQNNAGGAFLAMKDSVIYFINKGRNYADMNYATWGAPFIAAFDSKTGKQKYLSLTKLDQIPIQTYSIGEDALFLLFKNKFAKYDLETGSLVAEKFLDKEIYGNLKFFVGNRVFVKNSNGDLINLWSDESLVLCLANHRDELLSVDKELNVNKVTKKENVVVFNLGTDEYGFLSPLSSQDEKTYIVNSEGNLVAELSYKTSNAFIINDILYARTGKRYIIFDLKDM
jgi:outer membrane protein assembly factor BamB